MLEKIIERTTLADIPVILIVSFALVAFWRGVWGLLDLYLFPDNRPFSYIISVLISLVILILIALYRRDRVKNLIG